MTASEGIGYFLKGFSLVNQKGIRRFVIIPLIVNFILFSTALYYLIDEIGIQIEWLRAQIPSWLSWIEFILFPLALFIVLLIFSMVFSSVANWLAAPFNGVLAERVEQKLTGVTPQQDSLIAVIKAIPHTLKREWQKLVYFVPRLIGFLLIGWFFPVIGQIAWFLFIAWSLAIQYCDYAFDNNRIEFDNMRFVLRQNKRGCIGFGSVVSIFTMVPILNLIVMPVAICGATAMWVEQLQKQVE